MNIGVLVIAHGSRSREWVDGVDEAVSQVVTDFPITVGYLELVLGRSIKDGVRELEKQGVDNILVIPLFVSSGSSHLEEIRYALGVQEESSVLTSLGKIHPVARIHWCPAMDDHPRILEILADRVRSLSQNPDDESLLLIAHGSEYPDYRRQWEKGMIRIADSLNQIFHFKAVDFALLQSGDLPEKKRMSDNGELLVLPVFLSPGYFTREVIPQKLAGWDCRYQGETLLPHPGVSRWLEETIQSLNK
ncbi:cobalamin biosynthesis protein CbiX [Kroppenstedtia pulmonis]|uniref:Cobalamin biosynthesis protein CbiX n=1 Tax=Kroppenstedtia pulmonis TaxID=1380685 RepID=A0A7D3XZT0_9BACL|nr:CbiX/SirB N-terminal domain-containing protein [Kroppenstedtia pulmonis]QKG83860.1 cobalamin biosynthesis protein CbiX [Kroppenstedtia pulmonis]